MIQFKQGNIFDENVDIVVNTVNCVGVMGKGIALECKNKFPENFAAYRKICDKQILKPGGIHVFEEGDQTIINLATKDHWKNASKYEWILKGLDEIASFLNTTKKESIAIPPIGCGNGGLEWTVVKKYIVNKLDNINKDIIVIEPNEFKQQETSQPKSEFITWKHCGCKVPRGKLDIDLIPKDCEGTWKRLIANGMTIGVFQLETKLGQDWSKKARPNSIDDLACLTALLRPGCLENGMADEYVEVKSGRKQISYLHPALEPILKNTYGSLVYQEQAIKIATEIAGFSLEKADDLRKAIGKKIPELMAKCKKDFIEGCAKKGLVNTDQAAEIFGWIEKSQRYSFNKSHAVSYALLSYETAWSKFHFPLQFYTSYLNFAKYKSEPKEEIKNLVHDAKLLGIKILPPDIRSGNLDFCKHPSQPSAISFGLSHILGIGESAIKKISKMNSWIDFLLSVPELHKNIAEALVMSGACDYFGISRNQMMFEMETIFGRNDRDENGKAIKLKGLTDKEFAVFSAKLQDNKNVLESLKYLTLEETKGIISKRKEKIKGYIQEFATDLKDTNTAKAMAERHFLGIPLSCSAVDDISDNKANNKCIDFAHMLNDTEISLCCVVEEVKHTKTKKGKNPGQPMCIMNVSDSSLMISGVVVFPQEYAKYRSHCRDQAIIYLEGQKRNGSLIVSYVEKML